MDKKKIQLILGVILIMAGMGVFYRIPQVMPKIATIKAFASSLGIIKFSFYMLGVFLIFGGAKKIHDNKNGNNGHEAGLDLTQSTRRIKDPDKK